MKRIAYIIAAIAAVAVVGCQKFEKETVVKTRTLVCSFDATKTTLDDNGKSPKWAVGDQIKLIDATGSQVVTLTTENIKDDNRRIEIETGLSGETIYAVYPADAAVSTSVTDDIVEFTTAGQDGTFAKANICVAKENNGTLSFQNATAIVKLTNAKTDGVQYIDIKPTTGYMFGTCSADLSSAIAVSAPSKDGDNYSFGTNYNVDSKVAQSSVPVFSNDEYYLAVPYGLEYSIVAEAYTFNGGGNKISSVKDYSKNNPLTPERNIIYTCAL